MNVSKSTLNEVDVVTFIVDNSKKIGPLDENIIVQLKGVRTCLLYTSPSPRD